MSYCNCRRKKPFVYHLHQTLFCDGCDRPIKEDTHRPVKKPVNELELVLEPKDYDFMASYFDDTIKFERRYLERVYKKIDEDIALKQYPQLHGEARERFIEAIWYRHQKGHKEVERLMEKKAYAGTDLSERLPQRAKMLENLFRTSELDFSLMSLEDADPLGGDRVVAKVVGFKPVCGLVRPNPRQPDQLLVRVFTFADQYPGPQARWGVTWEPFNEEEWDISSDRIIVEHVTNTGIRFCLQHYFEYARPSVMCFKTGHCYQSTKLPKAIMEQYSGLRTNISLVDGDKDITWLCKVEEVEPIFILFDALDVHFGEYSKGDIPNPFFRGIPLVKDKKNYILQIRY